MMPLMAGLQSWKGEKPRMFRSTAGITPCMHLLVYLSVLAHGSLSFYDTPRAGVTQQETTSGLESPLRHVNPLTSAFRHSASLPSLPTRCMYRKCSTQVWLKLSMVLTLRWHGRTLTWQPNGRVGEAPRERQRQRHATAHLPVHSCIKKAAIKAAENHVSSSLTSINSSPSHSPVPVNSAT